MKTKTVLLSILIHNINMAHNLKRLQIMFKKMSKHLNSTRHKGQRIHTWIVNTTATTRTAYPALYDLNSCTRFLATNAQNIITGTVISDIVTRSDLASGPNISLPPRINFCKR